jgi:hypothetical protein
MDCSGLLALYDTILNRGLSPSPPAPAIRWRFGFRGDHGPDGGQGSVQAVVDEKSSNVNHSYRKQLMIGVLPADQPICDADIRQDTDSHDSGPNLRSQGIRFPDGSPTD